eukprot:8369519-Pyramimonas_sp.AAC.1
MRSIYRGAPGGARPPAEHGSAGICTVAAGLILRVLWFLWFLPRGGPLSKPTSTPTGDPNSTANPGPAREGKEDLAQAR